MQEPSEGVQVEQPKPSVTNPPRVNQVEQPSAVNTRTSQENARMAKALEAIGIDPSSEVVDAIANGTITKEQLNEMVGAKPSAPAIPQNPEPQTSTTDLRALSESLKNGEITKESFVGVIENIVGEIQSIQNKSKEQELTDNYLRCMEAVSNNVPDLQDAPQEVVSAINEILWAVTNETAVREGQKAGRVDAYFNPEAYNQFAAQNAGVLTKIIEYARNSGKEQYSNSLKRVPANRVGVIGSGDGGGSVEPRRAPITASNMKRIAQSYLDQMSSQV